MTTRQLIFTCFMTLATGLTSTVSAQNSKDESEAASLQAPAKWQLTSPEASENHRATESDDKSTFSTELEAVVAATRRFNSDSIAEDREYIGALLRHKSHGHYQYTVAAGAVGHDRISAEITTPSGYEVTAFWHTHGAGNGSRHYFSAFDTALVRQWQKPFYLADSSGYLKVFSPGDRIMSSMQARRKGLGHARGSAAGKRVRHQDGELVRIPTL